METTNASALLLLDLPLQALAAIDLLSFTTTPRFQGVKNLPPGFHFVFVGASNTFSERHGLWFEVKERQSGEPPSVTIARWDASSETVEAVTDEAEHLTWRANLGSIWRGGLTPYRQTTSAATNADEGDDDDQEELVEWPKLSSSITTGLLSRILHADSSNWTLSSSSSAKRDLEAIPGLSNEEITSLQADKELDFLPIDLKQTWREGATGRERTDAAQDRSWALNHIFETNCTNGDSMEIVGELQFCFLMILTVNNFSCLEQWKRILELVFTCRTAVRERSDFFIQVLKTLTLQLQNCKLADSGLIDLADESGSLLKSLLTRFRKGLESLSTTSTDDSGLLAVVDELDDLEDYLRTEHGWQFGGSFAKTGMLELEDGERISVDTTAYDEEDETGEYAPQIVDLTPEQAGLLNVCGAEELHHHLRKTKLRELVEGESSDELDEELGGGEKSGVDDAGGGVDDEEEEMDVDGMDARF
jgi:A1 cistron-splicing factor AAR2